MKLSYITGHGPSGSDQSGDPGQPRVLTHIWREDDTGWVADIIEAAWSRWLAHYPKEWRTVGQAIPYVRLRTSWPCDRPRTAWERESERIDHDGDLYDQRDAREAWQRAGGSGPPPESLPPEFIAHTHTHDRGICLDPWLAGPTTDGFSIESTLRHELAHAIAGSFGHGDAWLGMCEVIGHELSPAEQEQCEREREARAMGDEPPVGR